MIKGTCHGCGKHSRVLLFMMANTALRKYQPKSDAMMRRALPLSAEESSPPRATAAFGDADIWRASAPPRADRATRAEAERGRGEARAGKGGEAKARGGH